MSTPARTGREAPATLHLIHRLHRIEGQVRGIAKMVERDAYCIDVLTQVSAASRALQGVALALLEDHMHHSSPRPPVVAGWRRRPESRRPPTRSPDSCAAERDGRGGGWGW